MFMTRKSHRAEMELVLASHAEILRNLDRVIDMQERRISDLKSLVFIPKTEAVPQVLEADSVLGGSEKPFAVSEEEHTRLMQGMREADLLISGNYDSDLINE